MKKIIFLLVLNSLSLNVFADCMNRPLLNECTSAQWNAYNQQQNMVRNQQETLNLLQQQQQQMQQMQQQIQRQQQMQQQLLAPAPGIWSNTPQPFQQQQNCYRDVWGRVTCQ